MLKCLVLLSFIVSSTAFSQQGTSDETPVAKVGKETITRQEFVTRYESNPGFQQQIESRTQINKEVFLFALISEKLLAQEARTQGLESDSLYLKAVKGVEDPLVRDELYRKEVRDKVVNSTEEIADAVAKSQLTLNIYILYAPTKAGADFLESQIRAGTKLENISFVGDSASGFMGPDSMTVHWGDNNEEIEDAAYSLKLGQTSEPIQFGDGWYILKLIDESITTNSGAEEQETARRRAEEILSRRKEAVRMVDYLGSALKDEKADANGILFNRLAETMFTVYEEEKGSLPPQSASKFILTSAVCDSLNNRLADNWDDPFVTFPETKWTLGDAVDRIFGQGFGVADPTPTKIKFTLDQALRNIIYQEELTQIGYQMHLEKSTRVQQKLSMWKDFYLANLLKQKIADTLSITDEDVKSYMANMKKDSSEIDVLGLSELTIESPQTAAEVTRLINQKMPFEEVMRAFGSNGRFGDRARSGYFTVSELGSIGQTIEHLPIGSVSGPFHTREGYLWAKLLSKQKLSTLTSDPNVDPNVSIKRKLVADRLKYAVDTYVARLAEETGVDIYASRLAETKVTSLPTLMFQLLGFGGRMFAVPLVAPKADWVQYWDVRKHLVP